MSTGRTGFILGVMVLALMLATFAYFWTAPERAAESSPADSAAVR